MYIIYTPRLRTRFKPHPLGTTITAPLTLGRLTFGSRPAFAPLATQAQNWRGTVLRTALLLCHCLLPLQLDLSLGGVGHDPFTPALTLLDEWEIVEMVEIWILMYIFY